MKPSFMTSTFSILSLLVIGGYVVLCFWVKDLSGLKELAFIFAGVYTGKKFMEMKSGPPSPPPSG